MNLFGKQFDLPSKDKHGNSFTSYSQISLFNRSKSDFYKRYVLREPFTGNQFTDFGNKVGNALRYNDFSEFSQSEKQALGNCRRLDEFEKRVILKFDGFYIKGFVDTNTYDYSEIIDYKTGGPNKERVYMDIDYYQLHYYALAIQQQHGILPEKAYVNFIRRAGNPYRNQRLSVLNDILLIEIDISTKRLNEAKEYAINTVIEIQEFYKSCK